MISTNLTNLSNIPPLNRVLNEIGTNAERISRHQQIALIDAINFCLQYPTETLSGGIANTTRNDIFGESWWHPLNFRLTETEYHELMGILAMAIARSLSTTTTTTNWREQLTFLLDGTDTAEHLAVASIAIALTTIEPSYTSLVVEANNYLIGDSLRILRQLNNRELMALAIDLLAIAQGQI